MKKHFKKRLAAFKVGLVLSIMITPFCFYKIAAPVSALTNVITTNNYGSFERINETFSVSGVVGFSASSVRGNLNGVYNGTVRIYISISGSATISDFSVVPENCFIQDYSSSYVDIAFNGVSQWEVTFIGTTYNAHSYITINSLTNWNMSYRGQSSDELFIGLKTTVEGFTQYIDQLEQYTGAINRSIIRCENLLTTIAQNGTGGGSSVVTNIDANVDLAVDDLNLLKTSNDSILSTLLGFLTDSLGQVITLDSLLTAIESTTTELQTVNTHLITLETSLNSIITALNNINNQVSVVTWNNITNWILNGILQSSGSYSNDTITNSNNLNVNIDTTAGTNSNRYPKGIYKIHLPYRLNVNTNQITNYNNLIISIRNGYTSTENIYYEFGSNGIDLFYIYNSYQQSRQLNVDITYPTNSVSIYYLNNDSFSVQYVGDDQLEYWNILQTINQFRYSKSILSALQNLSININGDIVTQTENVINNYDTDFTTINNIESNFTNNFDNTNPGVISLFNSNLQIPQGFVDGSTFVKTLFPKVVDTNSLVGFPYFLILAIVVLIVILG